jgi:signal peptidase
VLAFGLMAVAVIAWTLLLRPESLGGSVSYDLVSGTSMEPTLHESDLVLARKQSTYQAGDIVTFRVEGGNVIHRIVGGSAEEGFIMQGDNNDAADPWQAKPDDILGKMWIRIPSGGRAIEVLRTPLVLAAIAAAMGVYMILGIERREKGRRKEQGEPPP